MTLTSIKFILFLAVALSVYFLIPRRMQYGYLLLVSIAFYVLSATPWTILYLFAGLTVAYIAVCLNERLVLRGGKYSKAGKWIIFLAVALNLAVLVLLKYLNLFINTANGFASLFSIHTGWGNVNWVASLGLSFYTLQLIGYIMDCYWNVTVPEKNYIKFALFACYFPELTSGPIVRFEDVKDQLYAGHGFEAKRVCYGLWRILWGFFKKLLLAETLAKVVNAAYQNPDEYLGFNLWIATFAFCFQLYADFSGCMDIILGVSECFGIYLPENFNVPFFSKTIQEFWQRWHITLGQWLRDYIMNPILKSDFAYNMKQRSIKLLGKQRGKKIHVYFAMLFLWLAMGLWHGGSWKYAVGEGLWYWFLIVLGQCMEKPLKKLAGKLHLPTGSAGYHVFQSVRTFLCFSVGMVFFRADSTRGALRVIKRAFTGITAPVTVLSVLKGNDMVYLAAGFLLLAVVDAMRYKGISVRDWLAGRRLVLRWGILYLLIFIVVLQSVNLIGIDTGSFIYGQF